MKARVFESISSALGLSMLFCLGLAGVGAPSSSVAPTLPANAAPAVVERPPRFARTFDVAHFLRGNLHTHTTLSDGHSSPEQTIAWYARHGYDFLAITDHNLLSKPSRYAALQEPLILIPGEEVTMTGAGRQVHVNALCISKTIPGGAFRSTSAALSNAIMRVTAQGGVALINHPNFDWGLSPEDVIDARDAALLEIASGHPYVHTAGDSRHLSHEALWDVALAAGANYMGAAVDDVHRIDTSGNPLALPGYGWVEVFGDKAEMKAICGALGRGELYSSTGVELTRIAVTENEYRVESARPDVSVVFVGRGGRELSRVDLSAAKFGASYSLRGNEGYVRVRIESRDGKRAWTPAVPVIEGAIAANEPRRQAS